MAIQQLTFIPTPAPVGDGSGSTGPWGSDPVDDLFYDTFSRSLGAGLDLVGAEYDSSGQTPTYGVWHVDNEPYSGGVYQHNGAGFYEHYDGGTPDVYYTDPDWGYPPADFAPNWRFARLRYVLPNYDSTVNKYMSWNVGTSGYKCEFYLTWYFDSPSGPYVNFNFYPNGITDYGFSGVATVAPPAGSEVHIRIIIHDTYAELYLGAVRYVTSSYPDISGGSWGWREMFINTGSGAEWAKIVKLDEIAFSSQLP